MGRHPPTALAYKISPSLTHSSRQVWHVSELMVAAFMPTTPKVVFIVITVLLAGHAVRRGLEVFTRAYDVARQNRAEAETQVAL